MIADNMAMQLTINQGDIMDLSLIIQLVSGAIGGNVAGKLIPSINQGGLINSIGGIVGGGLGGQILGAVLGGAAPEAGGADIGGIIGSLAGGGVGGGVVLAVISFVRNKLGK